MSPNNRKVITFRYQKKAIFIFVLIICLLAMSPYILVYIRTVFFDKPIDTRRLIALMVGVHFSYITFSLLSRKYFSILFTSNPSLLVYDDKIVDYLMNEYHFSDYKSIILNDKPTTKELFFPFLRKGPIMGYEMIRNDNARFHITNHGIRSISHEDLHQQISNKMRLYRESTGP